ncbi:MAG: hypothetical protein RXS42_07895 [Nitrososphaeria archaeon]
MKDIMEITYPAPDGSQFTLRFEYKHAAPEELSVVPRLNFDVEVTYITMPKGQEYAVELNYMPSKLKIISKEGQVIYTSSLIQDSPFPRMSPNTQTTTRFYTELDHYRLAQVEKIREGGDLQIRMELSFIINIYSFGNLATRLPSGVSIDGRIPKSDWVERILPQLKFKDVSLIEIPKIENPEFGEVINEINDAWKQYSMGEYDKVLTGCRKAMEALGKIVKDKGFKKEATDEKGEKKTVPDWEKAVGDEKIGKIIEDFVQKLFGFLAPGSHYGKSINREDAELAILNTHALVNYVARKLPL